MAFLIIPQSFHISVGNIKLIGWRIYSMVCAIPPFITWIGLVFMPNSPRFLIQQGQSEKTLQVMNKIHRINKRCKRRYEEPLIELSNLPTKDEIDDEMSHDYDKQTRSVCSPMHRLLRQYAKLYLAQWRKRTVLMTTIWLLYCFSTYGLWLWIPTLYSLYAHGRTCGQLQDFLNSSQDTRTPLNQSLSCATRTHDFTIYRNLLISTIAVFAIEVFFISVINYFGRRLLFSGPSFLSSLTIFAIWLTKSSTGIVICACFFSGFNGAVCNILNIWSSELYPTHLRSTSNG